MSNNTTLIIIGIFLIVGFLLISPETFEDLSIFETFAMWTGPGSLARSSQSGIDSGVLKAISIPWTSKTQTINLPGNKGIKSLQLIGDPDGEYKPSQSYVNIKICNEYNCYYEGNNFKAGRDYQVDECYQYPDTRGRYYEGFQQQMGWVPSCEQLVLWDRVVFSSFYKLPVSEQYTINVNVWRDSNFAPKYILVWYYINELRKAPIPTTLINYRSDGRVETDGSYDKIYTEEEICNLPEKDLYNVDCTQFIKYPGYVIENNECIYVEDNSDYETSEICELNLEFECPLISFTQELPPEGCIWVLDRDEDDCVVGRHEECEEEIECEIGETIFYTCEDGSEITIAECINNFYELTNNECPSGEEIPDEIIEDIDDGVVHITEETFYEENKEIVIGGGMLLLILLLL